MVAHGRDISAYDTNVNYSAYEFIIGKFTEGSDYIAPGAADRAHRTRAAGKVFSAYHFAQPGDGAQQASFFVSVGKPQAGDISGWLDYEVPNLGIDFVNAFTDRYRALTGYWPGVYANRSTFQGELQSGRGWRRPGQRFWCAEYDVRMPSVTCDIWQYQGGPDLDIAFTPLSDMVIGGPKNTNGGKEMSMVTLSAGRVAVVVRGTDHRIWARVLNNDGSAVTDWRNVWERVIGSSVDAASRDGEGLDMVTLDASDQSVLFLSLKDATAIGSERPYVQDLRGTGLGTPAISATNGDLLLSVAGTQPHTGEVFLNRWEASTNTWRGWWDAGGQAG